MKILVTGTAGFIGFHLAQKLIDRGDEVVGIEQNNISYGSMTMDFTYIDDIMKVMDNPTKLLEKFDPINPNTSILFAPYRIYNIGSNSPVKLLDFSETLESLIGISAKKNFIKMVRIVNC